MFALSAHHRYLHACFAIIALLTYYMLALFMFALNFKLGIPPLFM
jgi:hypothetical protein